MYRICIFSVLSPAESTDLDVVLDDTIVEAAWKRRVYPKRILPHVVHSLRAERKLMVGSERLPDLLRQYRLKGRTTGPTGPESKQEIPFILLHFDPREIHVLVPVFVFSDFFVFLHCLFFQGLYEKAVKPEEVVKDPDQGHSSSLSFFIATVMIFCDNDKN